MQLIRAIDAGVYHVTVLRYDGFVKTWGGNIEGELGDGTRNQRSIPGYVIDPLDGGRLRNVKSISASGLGGAAVKNDGTVKSWGWNYYGQIGDGTAGSHFTSPDARPVATQVLDPADPSGKLTGITSIATGYNHTLAIKIDGTVRAWGGNDNGQLADGLPNLSSLPVQVLDPSDPSGRLTGVKHVVAGYRTSYSLGVGNISPFAVFDQYTVDEDTTLNVTPANGVLANDSDLDGDSLTAILVDGLSTQQRRSFNPDGSFTYTPPPIMTESTTLHIR